MRKKQTDRTLKILEKIEQYAVGNYKPWFVADRGRGAILWDTDDNDYLDLMGAYAVLNVGHCHPKIVAVVQAQMDKLALVSRATPTEAFAEFCEKVVYFCGFDPDGKVLPALGGHEAVEKAIKIFRKYGYEVMGIKDGKAEIVACHGSFHGRTFGPLSLMDNNNYKKNFGPFLPGFVHIPFGDVNALKEAITGNTVAFFVEPIQGEGGVIIPTDHYLQEAAEVCRENEVLLVLDEIQTGFGRTGHRMAFHGYQLASREEYWEPDLVIFGKGFSGGLQPISGVVGKTEIMSILKVGDDGSTYAGNPLSCVAALEAIRVLEQEDLCRKSYESGKYFISELQKIRSRHIKEARGRGLMIGVELKDSFFAEDCAALLRNEGILCGVSHNVLRISPPLNITRGEIDEAVLKIQKVLGEK